VSRRLRSAEGEEAGVARSSDGPRKRPEIDKDISERREKIRKKNEEGQQVVEDKKTAEAAADRMNVEGTTEGVKEAKEHVEKSGDAADREFEKKESEAKGFYDEAKENEGDLDRRENAAKQDEQTAKDAAGRVKTEGVKRGLDSSARASRDDAGHLGKEEGRQKSDREAGEKKTNDQKREIGKTKIKFRSH